MLISILFMLLGIALLYYGGEFLVKGSSRLALHLGIRPLIIGLTVVSFGTSAPELFTSLAAQIFRDSSNVAIGNVIGSNIYNIGLVLGLSAILAPIAVHSSFIRREIPICIGASCLILLLMRDDLIGRIDSIILLVSFCAYIIFQFTEARRSRESEVLIEQELDEYTERLELKTEAKLWWSVGLIVVSSLMLAFGADFLVKNAITMCRMLGISERVIGLTAVAFGTSLPELATSIVATIRKEADIAIGNVVGSNIFNILLIVGTVAILKPLSFDAALLSKDGPFMLGLTFLMMILLITGRSLRRWEGGVLLLAAVGYSVMLFL